jgi:hypothetical protein
LLHLVLLCHLHGLMVVVLNHLPLHLKLFASLLLLTPKLLLLALPLLHLVLLPAPLTPIALHHIFPLSLPATQEHIMSHTENGLAFSSCRHRMYRPVGILY